MSVFAGKKRMGERGRRERVGLHFSTSCLFSCVRIGCQRWYHVGGMSIKSGCESHTCFGNLGWLVCGLLVVGFVKMSTRTVIVIPGIRASLSTCVPQMVPVQTAWNSTTRIKEVQRTNAVITPGRDV